MTTPTTFGASIMPTPADGTVGSSYRQLQQPHLDSPALTPSGSRDGSLAGTPQPRVTIPIQSPFYEHPPASHEAIPVHSRRNSKDYFASTLVNEKDLESNLPSPLTPAESRNAFASQLSVDCHTKECTMWPSRQTLMQNKKEQKKLRRDGRGWQGCAPVHAFWARFDKRQKLYIKIGIALFLIGVAVAIGVGISVAVNGSVYSTGGGSHPIHQG